MSYETEMTRLLDECWHKRGKGDYSAARDLVKQAEALCEVDDHRSRGRIFHIYAQFESDRDNYQEALVLYQKSLGHYNQSNDSDRIAHSTRHVADVQHALGQISDSESNFRTAIELYRSNAGTSKLDLANALGGFASVLEKANKNAEAMTAWEETRDLYRACGLQEGVDEANRRLDLLR